MKSGKHSRKILTKPTKPRKQLKGKSRKYTVVTKGKSSRKVDKYTVVTKSKNKLKKTVSDGNNKRKRGTEESKEKEEESKEEESKEESKEEESKERRSKKKKVDEKYIEPMGDYPTKFMDNKMDIEYVPPEPDKRLSNYIRKRIIDKYKGIPMKPRSTAYDSKAGKYVVSSESERFNSLESAMIKYHEEIKNRYNDIIALSENKENLPVRQLEALVTKKDEFTKKTLNIINEDKNILEKIKKFVNAKQKTKFKEIDMFFLFSKRDALPIIEITSISKPEEVKKPEEVDKLSLVKQDFYGDNEEELLDAMNNLSYIKKSKLSKEFVAIKNNGEIKTTNDVKFTIRKEIVNAVDKFTNTPEKCTVTSQIPLYFVIVVGATRGIHVVICILVDNQMYTFGFIYLDKGEDSERTKKINSFLNSIPNSYIKKTLEVFTGSSLMTSLMTSISELHYTKGAFLTPDTIFNPSQVPSFENRIVDIGILTKANIDNLLKFTNEVKQIRTFLFEETTLDDDEKYNSSYGVESHQLFLNVDYDMLSSSLLTAGKNCASFIMSIFPNINCESFTLYADPKKCKSEKNLDEEKINEIFKVYINNDVEGLKKMIQPSSSWW